eukprot:gene23410-30684_t
MIPSRQVKIMKSEGSSSRPAAPLGTSSRAGRRSVLAASGKREVTLLDYGAGNVRSVRNAIRKLGYSIKELLFEGSEESGGCEGLGLIPGQDAGLAVVDPVCQHGQLLLCHPTTPLLLPNGQWKRDPPGGTKRGVARPTKTAKEDDNRQDDGTGLAPPPSRGPNRLAAGGGIGPAVLRATSQAMYDEFRPWRPHGPVNCPWIAVLTATSQALYDVAGPVRIFVLHRPREIKPPFPYPGRRYFPAM